METAEVEEDEVPEEGEVIPKDKAIIAVEDEETEKEPPAKTPKPVTWGQAFLLAAVCSFVAFIFAVLLSLGIIGSINNGLTYASTDQVQHLSRQIGGLESQIGALLEDIEGLRARIDNLESMTARIDDLEIRADELAAEMAITVGIVEEMNAQIAEIVDSTNRFQTFLNGLGELMDTLFVEPQEAP
jgi:prefoldin subunit 5